MTPAGVNFLKCAYAAPDFTMTEASGIPDDYNGKTLFKDDNTIVPVTFAAGKTTYLVVAPTPGTAFWKLEKDYGVAPATTDGFTPTLFPDETTFFPNTNDQGEDNNVNAFRYAGMSAELMCTSSLMNTTGDIRVQKLVLKCNVLNNTAGSGEMKYTQQSLSGLKDVASWSGNAYKAFPLIDGAYSVSTNTQPTFEFTPIVNGNDRFPVSGVAVEECYFNGHFVGLGDMQTLVFAVSVPTGATAGSCLMRVWHCVEYTIRPSSLLHPLAKVSPPLDPIALECYRSLSNKLPVAVTYKENGFFWELVKAALNAASLAPNPIVKGIGMAGSGVATIIDAAMASRR